MAEHSIRKMARVRKEYMYRKAIEEKQAVIQKNKDQIKEALDECRTIPNHLQEDALKLMKAGEWDDEGPKLAVELGGEAVNIDDEYRYAGVENPKLVITTSHDPSSKLKQFSKEIKLLLPNSQRINRGNRRLNDLMDALRATAVTDFIILHEVRGRPSTMIISHLPNGPTAYFSLEDVIMRHDIPDIGTMSEEYPHLMFSNFETKLADRVKSILRYIFPVPKEESKRIISFINYDDFILFRHHNFAKKAGVSDNALKEAGPRFTLRLFKILRGAYDQEAASETEYVLRMHMNTAIKRKFLSPDGPFNEPEENEI